MKTILLIAGLIGAYSIVDSISAHVAGLIGVIAIFGFMAFLVMVIFRLVR
jgi:hypothetical protein